VSIQTVLLALIALAVGILAPIQMAANAQLAKGVSGAIAATIISFTAGWFLLILINSVGFSFPRFPRLPARRSTCCWSAGRLARSLSASTFSWRPGSAAPPLRHSSLPGSSSAP